MQQKRNKKKPKEELLVSISDSIILLINHLYPISEQLRIINKTLYLRTVVFLKKHI